MEFIRRIEEHGEIPAGVDVRYFGYGAMACHFTALYILGLRRFPVSLLGEGYTAVWYYTDPGKCIFYQDKLPRQGCPQDRFLNPLTRPGIWMPLRVNPDYSPEFIPAV